MNPASGANAPWITEFRKIKYSSDKIKAYNALSLENRKLLIDKLTRSVLTKDSISASLRIRDGLLPTFSNKFLSQSSANGILDLIHYLQVFDAGPVNLDLTTFTVDEITKHFQYGVYENFEKPKLPVSAKQAWVYGFSFPELLVGYVIWNHSSELVIIIDEFKLLIPSLMYLYRNAPEFKTFKNLLSYLGANLRMTSDARIKSNAMSKTRDLLVFINTQGLKFEESDGHGLPVWHMNHAFVLPSWPEYFFDFGDNSRMNSETYRCLKMLPDGSFPYPKFKKDIYWSYPKPLQKIIMTLLCLRKFHPASFSLHKDIFFGAFLNQVVWDFYRGVEKQLLEWKELSQSYLGANEISIRTRAIDNRICPENDGSRTIEIAYRLAAYDMGWTGVISSQLRFGFARHYVEHWGAIKKEIKSGENRYGYIQNLIRTCYDNNIPLSLIRAGKVKITSEGDIVDLPAALVLAKDKHRRNALTAAKFIDRKSEAKRRRVELDE